MDNFSIASLQDYQSSIEGSFKKLERLFDEAEGGGGGESQKNLTIHDINNELKMIKHNISLIKFEIANLKDECNIEKWNEIQTEINAKNDTYTERLIQLKNGPSNGIDDPLNIDAKVDLSKMTSQQVMNRGDKILQADKNAINRMKKIVYQDLDTMKEVNKELLLQHEKLENADSDLKEIDNSLNRAGKQMKTMAKMIATDKLIMCLICCILLVVIAIVIASLVIDTGDEDKNATQDTFQN